jgi:glyoxylate reductase
MLIGRVAKQISQFFQPTIIVSIISVFESTGGEQEDGNMSKPKVFVTRRLPEEALSRIGAQFTAEVWADYAPPAHDTIKEKAKNADGLATLLSDRIDREILDASPNLQIISQMAVGFDNIDIKAATNRGILVTNTPDVLTQTTADFSWALLMSIARRVVEADNYVRGGKWTVSWHPNMMTGRDVYGKTIGLVGAGRIGCAVAERAKGFKMNILYYDEVARSPLEKDLGATRVSLEGLLAQSDFISIHLPLTKETYHIINKEKLSLVKDSSFIINNSRGPIVDEKALFEALSSKKIAGAGLDVFEQEPLSKNNPLLKLENVILAPHISSASIQTRLRMAMMVVDNLVAYFNGQKPLNLVNQECWIGKEKSK